jgi:hypothetical protein
MDTGMEIATVTEKNRALSRPERSEIQAMIQEAVAALREEIARAAGMAAATPDRPAVEPLLRAGKVIMAEFAERVRKGGKG